MCDPVTLIAAGVTAAGAIIGGIEKSNAGQVQAQIAKGNADIALRRGLQKENQVRANTTRVLDNQTAHFAAAGLDPAFGSPLFLLAKSAAEGEVDARLVRADAAAEAAGFKAQSASLTEQASADRFAGYFGAGTALLQAGGKAWAGMPKTAGAPLNTLPAGFTGSSVYQPAANLNLGDY